MNAHSITDAIVIGMWSFLWVHSLTQAEHIFQPVRQAIHRLITWNDHFKVEGWRMAVYKVVLSCEACHAGQVAFWYQLRMLLKFDTFDIRFVVISIFAASLFTKWHTRK